MKGGWRAGIADTAKEISRLFDDAASQYFLIAEILYLHFIFKLKS
jgi:hypothetical protein